MPSKSSGIHSVRVPHQAWEQLTKEAELRGVTPNSLVVDFILTGLLRAAEARATTTETSNPPATKAKAARKPSAAPVQPDEKAPGAPVRVSIPLAGTFERKPLQKSGKR